MLSEATVTEARDPVYGSKPLILDQRKPEILSPPPSGEEIKDYVVRLDESCPVQSVFILGQTIHKFLIPLEASKVKNMGKQVIPRFFRMRLSKSQIKQLAERAKVTPVIVPSHRDWSHVDEIVYCEETREWAIKYLRIEEYQQSRAYNVLLQDQGENKGDVLQDDASTVNKKLQEKLEEKGQKRGSK